MTLDVTVIVPVYNAREYLEECIESLVGQTLPPERFEVLAVDDGSTDGSGELLDALSERHDNMTAFHQANSGGPASPRNTALEHASGRYVYFLDSDDYLGPEALERLVAFADEQGSDMVLGKNVGIGGRIVPWSMFTFSLPRADLFDSNIYRTLSASRLLRRELLERLGLRFREDVPFGEDQPFIATAYLASSCTSVLADYDCLYVRQRDDHMNMSARMLDLGDRMRLPAVMLALLADSIEPGEKRDFLVQRHIEFELLVVVQCLPLESDRSRQESAIETVAGWLDAYCTPWIWDRLPPLHRLCFHLVREGSLDQLLAVLAYDSEHGEPPAIGEGERVFVPYPLFRDPAAGIPDEVFEVTQRLRVVRYLRDLSWNGATLRIDGQACLSHMDCAGTSVEVVLWDRGTGEEYVAPTAVDPAPIASIVEIGGPRSGSCLDFTCDVDMAVVAGDKTSGPRLWDVSVRVAKDDIIKERRLGGIRAEHLQATRPRLVELRDGRAQAVGTYYTTPYGNLTLDVGDSRGAAGVAVDVERVRWDATGTPALLVEGTTGYAGLEPGALSVMLRDGDSQGFAVGCEVEDGVERDRFVGRVDMHTAANGRPVPVGHYDMVVRLQVGDFQVSVPVPDPGDLPTIRWWRGLIPTHARPSRDVSTPQTLTIVPIDLWRATRRRLRRAFRVGS